MKVLLELSVVERQVMSGVMIKASLAVVNLFFGNKTNVG